MKTVLHAIANAIANTQKLWRSFHSLLPCGFSTANLPLCREAALTRFWKRWQQLPYQQQPQEHWKAQDIRLLSVGAGSASMVEMLVLNLSSKRQVVGKVLGQPLASTEFPGKTDQIFGCLCRVQLKVTATCPSTRVPGGKHAIPCLHQLSVVQTDQTSVLEVGSGIKKVVWADVTRLASAQSLLRAS